MSAKKNTASSEPKKPYFLLKYLDHEYWLDARKIAKMRADYYAEVDGHDIGSKEWQEEFDYTLGDDYELIDWLMNNTDPRDFADLPSLKDVSWNEILSEIVR